jgi:hypothetical protein
VTVNATVRNLSRSLLLIDLATEGGALSALDAKPKRVAVGAGRSYSASIRLAVGPSAAPGDHAVKLSARVWQLQAPARSREARVRVGRCGPSEQERGRPGGWYVAAAALALAAAALVAMVLLFRRRGSGRGGGGAEPPMPSAPAPYEYDRCSYYYYYRYYG